MKKALKITGITLLSLIIIIGAAAGIYFGTYQATLSFDFSEKTGEVKKGASGYLYGIAENGVPSAEMTKSLSPQTVAQKDPGGLQHPTGDLDNADKMLGGVKYEVVYLQDVYDTWYYKHDDIMTLRSENKYDPQDFINTDYLPKVEKTVKNMAGKTYKAPIVYCLYNECDNGVWFGESVKDENPENKFGVWCDFNDKGKDNFYAAWKQTYELVKSLDKDALTGGPGYCDYDREEIKSFLTFCKENGCLPDVMIYHELAEKEAFYFDDHFRDYRALEKELGIEPLEVIITEYGMMSENGYPGEMVKYITNIENCKVYADNAYWRLADNFNDNCAAANVPNAQWWLMRWYTQMKGETVKCRNLDYLSSNFANYFKYHYDELSFEGFTGLASTDGKEIDVVCGGGERKSKVKLRNLDKTELYGKEVTVTVEETVYKGLYGAVYKPVTLKRFNTKLGKKLTVEIGQVDSANAYHIVIKESEGLEEKEEERPVRYEFENGKLRGKAYTYDSYCPASGGNEENHDLVGGMENDGDGVEVTINISKEGLYSLDFVYGNSNDGPFDKDGRQSPDGRKDTSVRIETGGKHEIHQLHNTVKSEYTSCYTVGAQFSAGEHTVRVSHVEGTCVLDSLIVSPYDESGGVAVLTDSEENTFLAVAPSDAYYKIETDAKSAVTDGAEITKFDCVFLKEGLNYISLESKTAPVITRTDEGGKYIGAEKFTLSGGAALKNRYIDNISAKDGAAKLIYNAESDGVYRLTFEYSNNEEGGVHDYNVDLIERYVTVSVNGKERGNCYCRNTYSWDTHSTATFTAELKKGDNVITLSNNGTESFAGKNTFAPRIYAVYVSPAYK